MKFDIDGREIEIEGLQCDTIVIVRPTKRINHEEMQRFRKSISNLQPTFAKYGMTPLCSNYDQVTFEVLTSKEGKIH